MTMKPILTALCAVAISTSAFAGQTVSAPGKQVAPPAPVVFGTGWYGGIEAGINAYQDFGGTRRFITLRGDSIALEPRENVGFVGGAKVGYVFGYAPVRPAIEA